MADASKSAKTNGQELSKEEEEVVQDLQKRDTEVQAHEHAHAAAGGNLAGAPSFEFTQGPDGKRYATSGEVQIDSSPVRGDPDATIRKMDIVIAAALAPASPSGQDKQVAQQAQQARLQAQAELTAKRSEEGDKGKAASSSIQSSAQEESIGAATKLEAQAAYGASADESRDQEDIATQIFAAASALSVFA